MYEGEKPRRDIFFLNYIMEIQDSHMSKNTKFLFCFNAAIRTIWIRTNITIIVKVQNLSVLVDT